MQITPVEQLYRIEARPIIADSAVDSSGLRNVDFSASSLSAALSDREVETLMLNLDASLRVYQRAHFFSWTQGLLQSLIRHEVLICALPNGEPPSMRTDSFSMVAPEQAVFGEMLRRDVCAMPGLVKAWEAREFRPMILDAADTALGRGPFAQELERVGATQVLVHGTHDTNGQVASFFVFACIPDSLGPRHAYLARLVIPFLHAAWVRTEIRARTKSGESAQPGEARKITAREQEILSWVCLGKSNYEIGAILEISPLTVKNHVQKILRKLDVVNRAQAVGKALELRILKH